MGGHPEAPALIPSGAYDRDMATIAVSGSSGLIGSALVALLREYGHDVLRLVRKAAVQPDEVGWDPARGEIHLEACAGVTAIVNLSGAPISRRWNDRYREELLTSRLDATHTLATAAATLGPEVALINASAVGYYGDRGREPLTEDSPPGTGFLAELVQKWEAATTVAAEAGNRVVLARTGLVISNRGGALGPLMPMLRAGIAGPLGSGEQIWPWISLRDEVRALAWTIEDELSGPVNLASPATTTNGELIKAIADGIGRPAVLRVPKPALRAALGGLAGDVLASQNQIPKVLLDSGFTFKQRTLDDLVTWLVAEEN